MAGRTEDSPRDALEALIATMRHPLRSRLLYAIADRPNSSAAQVSRRLGEPLPKVRRHLRQLVSDGMVGVAKREEKRGAAKTFYVSRRMAIIEQEEAEASDSEAVEEITLGILRVIVSDLQEATPWAGREAPRQDCVGRVAGFIDEQAWGEIWASYRGALIAAYDSKVRAEARIAAGESEPIPFASAAIFYEVEE